MRGWIWSPCQLRDRRAAQRQAAVAVPVSTSTRWRVIYRTSEKQVLLTGLSVIGQRDAWVARTAGYLHPKPLVLHWNGTNWQPVTLPAAPGFQPGGVQSTAANDV